MVSATPSTRKVEDAIEIDVVLDEETKMVGEDAQVVGKILCNVAQGWKETSQNAIVPAEEAAEYFFKKILRGARKVFRQVGKAGLEMGKHFMGQKAGEMIKQEIRERTGRHALGDDEPYSGLVLALSEDIDEIARTLSPRVFSLTGASLCRRPSGIPTPQSSSRTALQFSR
ncbi:unnamed protein product [Ixodes persulcatus]